MQMQFLKYSLIVIFCLLGCGDKEELPNTLIDIIPIETDEVDSMDADEVDSIDTIDYRDEMRSFVIKMSNYAKSATPGFVVIPQNGIELITERNNPKGEIFKDYLDATDANGQENLFYGYNGDDIETNTEVTNYLVDYLKVAQANGNQIFTIDYCSSNDNIENSIDKNQNLNFISFAATDRNLRVIPELSDKQLQLTKDIDVLEDASNFLFLVNYSNYETKENLINEVELTDYDIIFMDMFFNDGTTFDRSMIERLKLRTNGTKRMVICYMSIGEAENYRYYWDASWETETPVWLDEENPNWPGNYKVKYWNPEWQRIIYGTEESYLDNIIRLNFNGIYLDIVDAFEYYE